MFVLSGEQGGRVATGIKLYQEVLALRLLMTGGPVKWNVAAADIMADQAKFLGVPEKDIVLEKWAISTYENSLYSLMAPGPGDRSGGP
ncbi:YdcF family protein [Neomoorella thermoacetica]|uniref:YdcF family protein n=1 Tax=Neomoorella thermoacetica TaxID=1525 RepID=UPI0009BF1438|nr:YdcF family protein [Moorella thermoacetica]